MLALDALRIDTFSLGQTSAVTATNSISPTFIFGYQGSEIVTERYYANDTLLGLRRNGALYHALSDPSGNSMALADQGGSYMGRILYDGFGGVLSNTLPFTPNSLTGGAADAATGLVHVGDGRWLDPALGSVFQASAQTGDFLAWAQQQSIKVPTSQVVGKLLESRVGEAFEWVNQATGWAHISLRAERRLIPDTLRHLSVMASQRPALFSRNGLRGLFTDEYNTVTLAGRVFLPGLGLNPGEAANPPVPHRRFGWACLYL